MTVKSQSFLSQVSCPKAVPEVPSSAVMTQVSNLIKKILGTGEVMTRFPDEPSSGGTDSANINMTSRQDGARLFALCGQAAQSFMGMTDEEVNEMKRLVDAQAPQRVLGEKGDAPTLLGGFGDTGLCGEGGVTFLYGRPGGIHIPVSVDTHGNLTWFIPM